MNQQIENFLSQNNGKNVHIIQDGFMEQNYTIKKMHFSKEKDIFTVSSQEDESFLQFNTNQVYNVQGDTNKIVLSLDNDLKIEMTAK